MSLITNVGTNTMEKALSNALPQADSVDILTAYFYFSGFNKLADSLKDKHIRILVGKTIEPDAVDELAAMLKYNPDTDLDPYQSRKQNLSRGQKRSFYTDSFIKLFNSTALSEDFMSSEAQENFKVFEKKLLDGTLEIRMTKEPNHAKAYILTNKKEFNRNGDFKGTVLTGSSNLTFSGLLGQGELNQTFLDNTNYEAYSDHFNSLWNDSETVDICTKDGNDEFISKIQTQLWIHSLPDPYKVYIRVLYELYSSSDELDIKTPDEISGGKFSNLKYQLDAIQQGVDCINKYNGVIVADVVGLGKSIIASAIASNIDDISRTIIITPPHLKRQWEDYVQDFGIRGAIVESGGKIDYIHDRFSEVDQPTLFIIDEAHRYRNELTDDYQRLHQLTRSNVNNKVILLTATPYNNKPQDLFALIKLFQTPSRSTINSVDNLSFRFHELITDYKKLERLGKKNMSDDIELKLKELSQQLRNLISPVIIRRSRIDLKQISEYSEDLKRQGIDFSEVVGPELLNYDLGSIKDLYLKTLVNLTDEEYGFIGARYCSASYIKDSKLFLEKYGKFFDESDLVTAQKNLAKFMKRLLVMRFESSKYAFQSTLQKMMMSYETILKWWEKGYVPIQKHGDISDPEDLEDFDDIDKMMSKIDAGEDFEKKNNEALYIPSSLFEDKFKLDVINDLNLLKDIYNSWFEDGDTGADPKQEKLEKEIVRLLSENPSRKIVIFSTYADTAEWIAKNLKKHGFGRTFLYTGKSSPADKITISENFDASYSKQKNDYDIIVATDALSEGFNLHRAGIIINYDIPYNPTRVIQRIGRINRINKKVFDKIFIYNFFPTELGENVANVKGISTMKMLLINNIVGSDTRTLTPDEDLQSYFKKQYDEADKENNDLSWDVDFINDYNAIKHDRNLIRECLEIPDHTQIVRKNSNNSISVSFAKRGNNFLFAVADDNDTEAHIVSGEEALSLFKPISIEEKAFESDSILSNKFKILYDKITEKHAVPRIDGRRSSALDVIEFLISNYGKERDYLLDLKDTIKEYDDLSDGEMKFIAQLDLTNGIDECVKMLKDKFSNNYLGNIRSRAESVDNSIETIMFTEDLRK